MGEKYTAPWARESEEVSLRWHCCWEACVNAGHFCWHAIHLINRCSLDFTTHLARTHHTLFHVPLSRIVHVFQFERRFREKAKKKRAPINSVPIINFVRVVEVSLRVCETDATAFSFLSFRRFFYCRPVYFHGNISFRCCTYTHIFDINLSVSV